MIYYKACGMVQNMRAVIYLDSYFFMNMVLNGMLLYLLSRIRRLYSKFWRLFLAAAFGGLSACFLVMHPLYGFFLKAVITYFITGGGMIVLAFGFHGWRKFFQNLCWLITITIGLGGIVQFLTEQYIGSETAKEQGQRIFTKQGVNIIVMALFGTVVIVALFQRAVRQVNKENCLCHVTLFLEDRSITAVGLLDSGNFLKEPVSGKPVMVLEETVFLNLFQEEIRENMEKCLDNNGEHWELAGAYLGRMRIIPYKSIGKARGIMNGFIADRMETAIGKEKLCVMQPVLAVYAGILSADGSYQMILPGMMLSEEQ